MLLDENKDIITLLVNKNNINFYICNDKVFMKTDNISRTNVKILAIRGE